MHKIFAKPLFLGKNVIFLPECHSTNDEMMSMVKSEDLMEGTVIYSDHQSGGKGQRGQYWIDEPKSSVLMSILLKPRLISPSKQFLLNLSVGLSLLKTCQHYLKNGNVSLKWPNDVLVDGKKVCGILIENIIRSNSISYSIVGIGLNLNQESFDLPFATSLFLESQITYEPDDVIEEILSNLESSYMKLKQGCEDQVIEDYLQNLFLKDQEALYQDALGKFIGVIEGIDNKGNLIVKRDGRPKSYGIKEISLVR